MLREPFLIWWVTINCRDFNSIALLYEVNTMLFHSVIASRLEIENEHSCWKEPCSTSPRKASESGYEEGVQDHWQRSALSFPLQIWYTLVRGFRYFPYFYSVKIRVHIFTVRTIAQWQYRRCMYDKLLLKFDPRPSNFSVCYSTRSGNVNFSPSS